MSEMTGREPRHSSESNEHYTPPEVVEAARRTLGAIDLDPCTCWAANEIVKATNIMTKETGGHLHPWGCAEKPMRVLLNPAGGLVDEHWRQIIKGCNESGACGLAPGHKHRGRQSSAVKWFYKLAEEYVSRRVHSAIFIGFSVELLQTAQGEVPGLPDPVDFPICIPKKRLDFISGATMQPGGSPAHANAIVYMPPLDSIRAGTANFTREFASLGRILTPYWAL